MMRFLSVIIIVGVLLQTCSKQVIFVEYILNKNYIATVLCENKAAPAKHCLGKCHLKKELDRDNQRQENNDQKVKTGAEVILSIQENNNIILATSLIREIFYIQSDIVLSRYNPSVFHPPSC